MRADWIDVPDVPNPAAARCFGDGGDAATHAEQGLPWAQQELADVFFTGEGVTRDHVQAFAW